jgi:ArsR family transcriptional regulator, arsenate/arsenite/antimonite-responsive transcriptional repressor
MQDTARFFRVLGDDARLQMLWLLLNHEELCVCDVMAALGITQSKAARHLITLRHAGLVTDRKDGLWSNYRLCLAQEDELLRRHLELLRSTLAARPDADTLLEKLHAWLQAKHRSVVCAKDSHCAAVKKKTARIERARPSRAARLQ